MHAKFKTNPILVGSNAPPPYFPPTTMAEQSVIGGYSIKVIFVFVRTLWVMFNRVCREPITPVNVRWIYGDYLSTSFRLRRPRNETTRFSYMADRARVHIGTYVTVIQTLVNPRRLMTIMVHDDKQCCILRQMCLGPIQNIVRSCVDDGFRAPCATRTVNARRRRRQQQLRRLCCCACHTTASVDIENGSIDVQ